MDSNQIHVQRRIGHEDDSEAGRLDRGAVVLAVENRSEGAGFSGGVVDGSEPRGFNFEVDHGYFERVVWPAVANRFPAFEAAKCHRTWAGLYEQCELDGNPIIGNWPGVLENFHVCAGFSGHGMMHAPAAGRAIAERVIYGGDRSLDLGRLGYGRVVEGTPYRERGIL